MEYHKFNLRSSFKPSGSQPEAIEKLVKGIKSGDNFQTLLGVTGSGKTFTMANVIKEVGKSALVIVHNKTLAAQLYREFKELFPENRVEYFVSFYDYYQPESYLPSKDQYIEKDSQINPLIEQMRLASTASVLSRNDTIIVASVSCIYGLGNPANFLGLGFSLEENQKVSRRGIIQKLLSTQYERNDTELMPGRFRVKGDVIDIIPGYMKDIIRVELFGDEIERISLLSKNTSEVKEKLPHTFIFPARHFVTPESRMKGTIESIEKELDERLPKLEMIEKHRLKQRTLYDIEMLNEIGFCKGIENYSRHFDGRAPGEKPYCLLDYFKDKFLIIIDESHQTLPQLRAMYEGDKARKTNLVDFGFRLPSALDNRPLKFEETAQYFEKNNVVFVSATPGVYEKTKSSQIVEQIIRPTGLVDPDIEIRPTRDSTLHLMNEIKEKIKKKQRVLITTLTKRLAEELTDFLASKGIKTRYLHSEVKTLERTEILRQLRAGKFDVLVGINLLREGLDLPEVGLVAILDADKEGFLRDQQSLIQIIGRAARNSESKVIMYADQRTDSMQAAIEETDRRRKIQLEYNKKNKITPKTIIRKIEEPSIIIKDTKHIPKSEKIRLIPKLEQEMKQAAKELNFELAIALRDRINELKDSVQS